MLATATSPNRRGTHVKVLRSNGGQTGIRQGKQVNVEFQRKEEVQCTLRERTGDLSETELV